MKKYVKIVNSIWGVKEISLVEADKDDIIREYNNIDSSEDLKSLVFYEGGVDMVIDETMWVDWVELSMFEYSLKFKDSEILEVK